VVRLRALLAGNASSATATMNARMAVPHAGRRYRVAPSARLRDGVEQRRLAALDYLYRSL